MYSYSDKFIFWSYVKKLDYKDLIIFLIPFSIFLYYLLVFDPGVLSFDSFQQLHQISSNNFSNWHPFFHTFIEMLCIKIYASPISVGVLQIVVFSTMWTIICKYNRPDNIDKFDKIFVLQLIFTIIISLIPINALYSITLWKDILFSYFLMFLCFLIEVMIDKKNNISLTFVIILSIVMAFISQLRPNGMIIILILLIVFACYLFRKHNRKFAILLPILTILFILMISSLNVMYDVEDNQKDVILDKSAHILSYYDLNVNISDADKQKINEFLPENAIHQNFNIYHTDPTYGIANKSVYEEHKTELIGMVLKYSFENPLKFLGYVFGSSSMVWDITRDDDWRGNAYILNLDNARNTFYSSRGESPLADYDNVSSKNLGTPQFDGLKSIVDYFKENILLDTLFNNPATYMYLAFIVLIMLYSITRTKEIYLIYLPNLISILTVVLSTPIQDYRYLYANLLVFYLLIIILIGSKENPKLDNKKYQGVYVNFK